MLTHICVYMQIRVWPVTRVLHTCTCAHSFSHTCAPYTCTPVHIHTRTPVHTYADQTRTTHTVTPPPSRLPDQEMDADDTLRLGAPAPRHHCGLGLGPQVATTPGQEAVLPRYCLALAQHWGGAWGGVRATGERRPWEQGAGYDGAREEKFPWDSGKQAAGVGWGHAALETEPEHVQVWMLWPTASESSAWMYS